MAEAREDMTRLVNWLRGLRTLAARSDDVGEVFGGILDAFEDKDMDPEKMANWIEAKNG
jgi:hypothetical protein